MRKKTRNNSLLKRVGAFALALLMVVGILPTSAVAAGSGSGVMGEVSTIADPDTIRRHDQVYGNDTENAGKVTVGKSVSDEAVTIAYGNTNETFTPADDNFIVTVSQTAQVLGLAAESAAPVDVVFVLDTSSSMSGGRAESMVTAANAAISSLMAANENNRVGVVAFSSNAWSDVNNVAANQLSALAHYTGDAATAHLRWADRYGNEDDDGRYIMGRTNSGRRHGVDGGTNIHAGISLAADMLLNADTTVQIDGKTVTRMPFLVVLSDGAPTYSSYTPSWYDPDMTYEHGPGNNFYAGNGFLAALTAAYYKGKITEKYFGSNASVKNRCYVYTIGVGLSDLTGNEGALAKITMDPKEYFQSGKDDNGYYNSNGNNDFYSYWGKYTAATPVTFNVQTNNGQTTQISADSIRDTKNAVMGLSSTGVQMYTGGLMYNDDYFGASDTTEIANAFNKALLQIQKQSMASPTHVEEEHGADFSGYVTFTDPIGEYMEVKNIRGVLANGKLYEGKSFAYYLQNWSSAPAAFKEEFINVLKDRCEVTGSTMNAEDFIAKAVASPNQAYHTTDGYDNSLVWWGNSYTPEGEEDPHVQWVGFADNDTIEYITDPNTVIPENADYVCRSYYFYGTAGDLSTIPADDFLHFVVRVQRSLTAPYQETVVVSAPASLLSVEEVFVTEKTDASGNKTYTAQVTEAEPARVVYEVGLRSDINAYNVDEIVGADAVYVSEGVNYVDGTYAFYTNDWDRSQADPHKAMTKATFDAAGSNSFYRYTEDTLLYVKDGSDYVPYTGTATPEGKDFYYARTVYDWSDDGTPTADNTFDAVKRTVYIPVTLPVNASVTKKADGWYINEGVYKSSELTGGEDILKNESKGGNKTKTAAIVSHPHRTEDETNSHYTVLLGNNGKLTLKGAGDTKSVDITKADATQITDANGKPVMVGDTLTYKIDVVNFDDAAVTADVTDTIPAGTTYVPGSASHGGVYAGGKITWNDVPVGAGETVTLTFKVTVTEAALADAVITIDNTAHVTLSNGYEYDTNTTKNPPEGKKVEETDNDAQVQVPDVLIYRIRWYNSAVDADGNPAVADQIVIRDKIPAGTSYVENSASHPANFKLDGNTLVWTFKNVEAGANGVVSFRVNVNAAAGETVVNDAKIEVGENDPDVRVTNKPVVNVKSGDLVLSKTVTGYPTGAAEKTFTLTVTEIGLGLDGTYDLYKGTDKVSGGIEFDKGVATLKIKGGETFTIKGIPAGAILNVTEAAVPGFTATYQVNGAAAAEGHVTIVANGEATVGVTNTYAPSAATFQLEADKTLSTKLTLGNTEFGFVVYPSDASGNVDADAVPLTGEVTVSSDDKTESVVFSPITYTATGTYYYLIEEVNGGVTGVQYAKNQYLLIVSVTDDGSGALKASAQLKARDKSSDTFGTAVDYTDDGVAFTNKYVPLETSLTLEGKKTLKDLDLDDGMFSFEVKDSLGNVVSTGTNVAGEIIFKPITYKEVGTHTYTIIEVNGGMTGIDYDDTVFTVTVKVEDVAGKLVATPTYPASGVVFKNTFTPTGITETLIANKVLDNQSGDPSRVLKAGEFRFAVTDNGGNVVSTGTNDATGKVTFAPIGYTLADAGKTFTYTISEIIPDISGDPYMDYDESTFQVTVEVTYDSGTGLLSTNVTYPAGGVTFTNIQHPDSTEVTPKGTKTTTGTLIGDETFSFTVIDVVSGNEVGAGVANANGDFLLSTMSYSLPGTYRYWVKETHAGMKQHGIEYDDAVYLMEVVVTLTDGKLDADYDFYSLKSGGDADDADDYTVVVSGLPSFDNKYEAEGQLHIQAKKVLKNLTLKDGAFAFRLVRQDNGHEITGVNDGEDIIFATLYYKASEEFETGVTTKTIHYRMSEVNPTDGKIPGVTYDTSVHDVYITITHDGLGHVSAFLSDDKGNALADPSVTGITFTNIYAPTEGTSATIKATKKLTGRNLKSGEFVFDLIHVDEHGVEHLVDSVANDATGKFSFTRTYPATVLNGADSRKINYIIREVNNHLGGVKYDPMEVKVTVTIKDNKDGTMTASVSYPEDTEFNNVYTPEGTTFKPEATKELTGRKLKDKEFSFVIKDAANKTVSTGLNAKDGTIDFTPIGYKPEDLGGATSKTFTYTISEVEGNLPGVTYDPHTITLTVTVTDDGKGKMEAKGTYSAEAKFVNTYAPEGANVQLKGSKILTGRDMTAGEFSFIAKDIATGKVMATGGNAEAKVGVKAEVLFSNIGYQHADMGGATEKTFKYEITESDTAQGGVEFSKNVYYAKVVVVDNALTGKLEVKSVTYHADEACTGAEVEVLFENDYEPDSVEVVIPTDKNLINKKIAAGEFTFTLKEGTKVLQTKTNDADGVVKFDALKFTAADMEGKTEKTFTYIISESVTDENKKDLYTLDNDFKVVVTVTDNLKGQLIATVATYETVDGNDVAVGGVDFINRYTAPKITVPLTKQIGATKVLTGRDEPMKDGEFTFTVYDIKNNVVATGSNDASGKITFTDFEFKQAGEYHYWIVENATKNGVVRDERVWELHILVRYNENDDSLMVDGKKVEIGELYVADADVKTYLLSDVRAAEESAPAFVNKYVPTPTKVVLTAAKKVEGRDGKKLRDGEFLFRLIDRDSQLIVAEARNDANGNVKFEVTYTQKGYHKYEIVEVDEGAAGITYSTDKFNVDVNVTDDSLGNLTATPSYEKTQRTFVNTYKAAETTATVIANKTMTGDKSFAGEIFKFQLLIKGTDTVVDTAENDVNGMIQFTVPCTTAGQFTYVMRELDCDDDRITKDPNDYEVVVDVVDNWDGTLTATVEYPNDTVPTFVNTFTADPVSAKIDAKKELTGRDLEDGEFTFRIFDSHGTELTSATNAADGSITFPEIPFEQAGTYTLTVKEDKGTAENMTYDETAFKVVVTVTNNNGVLSAEVDYVDGDIVFKNEYEEPEEPTEETTEPKDPEKPGAPDTGDHANIGLYLALMAAAMCGAVLMFLPKRKKDY